MLFSLKQEAPASIGGGTFTVRNSMCSPREKFAPVAMSKLRGLLQSEVSIQALYSTHAMTAYKSGVA